MDRLANESGVRSDVSSYLAVAGRRIYLAVLERAERACTIISPVCDTDRITAFRPDSHPAGGRLTARNKQDNSIY